MMEQVGGPRNRFLGHVCVGDHASFRKTGRYARTSLPPSCRQGNRIGHTHRRSPPPTWGRLGRGKPRSGGDNHRSLPPPRPSPNVGGGGWCSVGSMRQPVGGARYLGAAARRRRSLMAMPRPVSGTGITAMARYLGSSRRRSMANRLAAASCRSAAGLRLSASLGGGGPEPKQRLAGLRRRGVETHRQRRGIVADQPAGRTRGGGILRADLDRNRFLQHLGQRLRRHRAGAQDARPVVQQAEHGGFDPDRARAAIDHELDLVAEIGEHVVGAGRRQAAGRIGARRRQRQASHHQQGLRDVVRRHADRDAVEPGGGQQRDAAIAPPRQHQGERAGPEAARDHLRLGRQLGILRGAGDVGDMHDQRIEAGPALGGKDRGDRAVAGGIAAQAIDRLGREGDQLAAAQGARRVADLAQGRLQPPSHAAPAP